jgi:hypothetical protein
MTDCAESTAAAYTVFVRHKVPLFADESAVKKFEKILLEEADKSHCEVPVYLFMPNRCHLLLQGNGGEANLVSAIRGFRQGSGYWLSRFHCDAEWRSNHDGTNHSVDKEVLKYTRHILNAPVRMGIAKSWREYRYKGSTLYHFESWL